MDADLRVDAALRRLRGEAPETIAADLDVDPVLVQRWSTEFLQGGRDRVADRVHASTAMRTDRLLKLVAHELRTPLAVQQGWLRLLRGGKVEPHELPEATDQIARSVQRLRDLVDDLLDATSAGLGRMRLNDSTFEVRALLDGAAHAHAVHAVADTPDIEVRGDRDRLQRVISHLVSALRDEEVDAPVRLRASRRERWVEIAVTRTDRSLPFEYVHGALEPFDGDEPRGAAALGVYLARGIVVAHGGHLGARAGEHETTFWFRLPIDTQKGER